MRLLGWLMAGCTLAVPALAPAQIVKRADLIGTWEGKTEYKGRESPLMALDSTGTIRFALWTDGLFMYAGGGSHGAGRWRLHGDTLWWGNDWRYGNDVLLDRRGPVAQADTVDTLTMPLFPKNDSLFWTASEAEKKTPEGNGYWLLTAYKISFKNGRLTMVRIDDVSNNKWHPVTGVYEYKQNEPVVLPDSP